MGAVGCRRALHCHMPGRGVRRQRGVWNRRRVMRTFALAGRPAAGTGQLLVVELDRPAQLFAQTASLAWAHLAGLFAEHDPQLLQLALQHTPVRHCTLFPSASRLVPALDFPDGWLQLAPGQHRPGRGRLACRIRPAGRAPRREPAHHQALACVWSPSCRVSTLSIAGLLLPMRSGGSSPRQKREHMHRGFGGGGIHEGASLPHGQRRHHPRGSSSRQCARR